MCTSQRLQTVPGNQPAVQREARFSSSAPKSKGKRKAALRFSFGSYQTSEAVSSCSCSASLRSLSPVYLTTTPSPRMPQKLPLPSRSENDPPFLISETTAMKQICFHHLKYNREGPFLFVGNTTRLIAAATERENRSSLSRRHGTPPGTESRCSLPPCDVCEDGLSRARLSPIRRFCCIVTESSQDSCGSGGGVSNRSPPAAEAFIQTASATPAVDALGWILPLLPC